MTVFACSVFTILSMSLSVYAEGESSTKVNSNTKFGVYTGMKIVDSDTSTDVYGSIGVNLKRGTDTVRLSATSTGENVELSADVRSRRNLAMVGLVSTNMEVRQYLNLDGDKDKNGNIFYIDTKGAIGNIMLSGRLFSIGKTYAANGTPSTMVDVSGVGITPENFNRYHSGLTGLGLGGKVRTSDIVAVAGDVNWGWAPDVKSQTDASIGVDISNCIPGTLTASVNTRSHEVSQSDIGLKYIVSPTENTVLNSFMNFNVAADPGLREYGASLRSSWGQYYLEPAYRSADVTGRVIACSIGASGSKEFKLSLQRNIDRIQTTLYTSFSF